MLVRWCLAAPPLVNRKLALNEYYTCLYNMCDVCSECWRSYLPQFLRKPWQRYLVEFKAPAEHARECTSIVYMTEAGEDGNTEIGQMAKPGGFGLYDQVTKRTRWMPWRQKAMKDVEVCDKPRGAGKRALIRGCPNGETHPAT